MKLVRAPHALRKQPECWHVVADGQDLEKYSGVQTHVLRCAFDFQANKDARTGLPGAWYTVCLPNLSLMRLKAQKHTNAHSHTCEANSKIFLSFFSCLPVTQHGSKLTRCTCFFSCCAVLFRIYKGLSHACIKCGLRCCCFFSFLGFRLESSSR
jgi:hypothetical protein